MRRRRKPESAEGVSRREFLATAVGSSLTPGIATSQDPAPQKSPLRRAGWIQEEPLVIVGNWDDMPIFRRRTGGGWAWLEDDYHRDHSEETVRKLKDAGVTLAILHFYKGFGLMAEQAHIADTIKLASLCHRHGLRVGLYVGSTLFYESFLLENAAASDWFVPDYLGAPVFYGHSTFRKRVYFMHPGYREYMKRVLRVAVEEVRTDLIHFDNTSMQAEPAIFQHPLAIEDFNHFLTAKYSPAQMELRLGFRDPKYVLPPRGDWTLSSIDDPLAQEWTDFRCQTLSNYYQEMAAFIHNLDPAVAIDCNPHRGLSGFNTYWLQGVDYSRLLAHTHAVWSEEGNEPGVTADGVLVSKIRTYKMASKLNNRVFAYTGLPYSHPSPAEAQIKLAMAEAMAYNRQCLGFVSGIRSLSRLPVGAQRYIQFFHRNFRLFRDVASAAEIAVLHSYASLAFNNDRPYQSSWLFEQALIQAKVPFDIIFDDHLRDLSRYRVLILADQENLSEEQLGLIRRFVMGGGGFVATESTSLYTERRELRENYGLADLLKVSAAAFYDTGSAVFPMPASKEPTPAPIRNQVGQGRSVYIAEVKAAIAKPTGAPMTSTYWQLPLNAPDLIDAVNWAAGDEPILAVNAPVGVTTDLLLVKPSGAYMIPLVNYDIRGSATVENIEVWLRVPDGARVSHISVFSPDTDDSIPVRPLLRPRQVGFIVPRLNTYCAAEVLCG